MRLTALLCIVASLIACGPPAYVRQDRSRDLPASNPDGETVWLLVVDGLRAQALKTYIESLEAEHFEPPWPSGLAWLHQHGKRLIRAQNAASPIETGGGAVATVLTGTRAHQHGVPASAWIDAPGGFAQATDDAFGVAFRFASLGTITIFDALPTVLSAAIFLPENLAGLSVAPQDPMLFTAWMDDRKAEYAAPLADRAARDAAVELIQSTQPPNLLGIEWRGVHGAYDQQIALRQLDGHLAELLAALERAHPKRLQRLHLVLVGTNPTTPLGDTPRHLDAPAIRDRLTELAPACAEHFKPHSLRVVADDRTARLYSARTQAAQACLHDALSRAHLHATNWLDGAAWREAGAPRVMLSSLLEGAIGASRTARLRARLETAAGGVLGDAVLFAAPQITFGRPSHEAKGGLRAEALDLPLLFVSGAFTHAAADAIASAPIEATDIAPTVVELAKAPPDKAFAPARPSLLTWRDGKLGVVLAPRRRIAAVPQAPRQTDAPAFVAPQITADLSRCEALTVTISPPDVRVAELYWHSRYRIGERRNRLMSIALPETFWAKMDVPPKPARTTVAKRGYWLPVQQIGKQLDRLQEAGPLGRRRPRPPLLERFGDTPATRPPRHAFLSLIACDAYDRCVSQPIISDRDFELLEQRCQP